MTNFKNRQVAFINRKRLEIKNVIKDSNDNMEALLVDVFRNEGSITEEGSSLEAQKLNDKLNLLEFLYQVLFAPYFTTLAGNITLNWTQEVGNLNAHTFTITFNHARFFAKLSFSNNHITGDVTNNIDNLEVKIDETEILNNFLGGIGNTCQLNFFIEFYTDSAFKNYLNKIKGTVNYTFTTSPPSV